MKFNMFLIFFLVTTLYVGAQKKSEVLFTVDNDQITTEEFLRVFNKNRDIVDKENKKTIDEYLDLYINYKLKLKQAYELQLDTIASYKRELKKYREQLIKPYLKDANITKGLVKEAYDRTKKEVNASHILLRLKPKASPNDTLKVYNRINDIRNEILEGKSFEELAKLYSEDPSARQNGGRLGYFSAFGMVYPFENAAYNLEKGEISMPFRTSFGYHITKVNDFRTSQGEVEVAHIMIKNDTSNVEFSKSQIQDIYSKLKDGESFDRLAQKYSDDKSSSPKGGRLQKFSSGRMIEPFSSKAFSLKNVDDITTPFQTQYGWHIVRLIKKHPIKSYEELEPELVKKIERSERAYAAGKSVANRLREDYDININDEIKSIFLLNENEKLAKNSEKEVFSLNTEKVFLKELIDYNNTQQKKSLLETFESFLDKKVIEYYKNNLENTNKEFSNTIQEYEDGLLLFDLLQLKIWKRSEKDTLGLKKYFNAKRDQYKYDKRVDVEIANCTNKEKALLVKELLSKGKTIEEIKNEVNENPTIHVLFSKGLIDLKNKKLPDGFKVEMGVSKVYDLDNNQYVVVKVNNILEPSLKEFKEARGLVMNDYQDFLEKEWIEELRASSKVVVHKKVLKMLRKQYSN